MRPALSILLVFGAAWRPLGVAAEPPKPEQWRALEAAIRDLTQTFGPKYPGAETFLKRLERMRESGD